MDGFIEGSMMFLGNFVVKNFEVFVFLRSSDYSLCYCFGCVGELCIRMSRSSDVLQNKEVLLGL